MTVIGVSGSRTKYWRRDKGTVFLSIYEELCRIARRVGRVEKIVHGCNYRSVDFVAEVYGKTHGIGIERKCPSNMTRRELRKRNREIVKESDMVVCFFVNGVTPGTAHTCREAVKSGKPVEIILIETERS